eukprot:TRINITY_DN4775_c0_g1_i3.p1 TRINITY_DN4775_c0_g1~~TRINITY_DN4775_c0_g1_i3.p1  ORF type:complete len:334 (-),score=63.73 TRINITY_DN4775_c0_g1_i3:94-1095(-)
MCIRDRYQRRVHGDYKQISPFNEESHYHSYCNINSEDFKNNQWRVENCRLADLPDLKQENPVVQNTLLQWIRETVVNYGFDGMRIDTVPEVPKWFWQKWVTAANSFTIGEVWDERLDYLKGYLDILGGLLNYPIFYPIKFVFNGMNSFWGLHEVLEAEQKAYGNQVDYLGLFVNNHDNERFLHINYNIARFKGAIAFTMLYRGIPIFYYGDEQGFKGANDPYCREALWPHMDTNSELYQYVKKLIAFRKKHEVWKQPYIFLYREDHVYAFSRGDIIVILSNADNYTMDKEIKAPYPDGTRMCNALKNDECYTCLLYTSPSPRDLSTSRMPSSA